MARMPRAKQIMNSTKSTKEYKGTGTPMTVIGVIFIPIAGVAASAGLMSLECVQDETSSYYVSDPIMVGTFCYLLCALIAYNFCMIFDHTADTLLYCYAWHKRHDKKNIDKFIPEKLRYIVGWDDMNTDKYPYYGQAPVNMYLSTFFDLKSKTKSKSAPSGQRGATDATSSFFHDDAGEREPLDGRDVRVS